MLESPGLYRSCCRELCQSGWPYPFASGCKDLSLYPSAAIGPARESSRSTWAHVWSRYPGTGCQCCSASKHLSYGVNSILESWDGKAKWLKEWSKMLDDRMLGREQLPFSKIADPDRKQLKFFALVTQFYVFRN